MKEISGKDIVYINLEGRLDANLTHWSKNETCPSFYYMVHDRFVPEEDIRNMKFEMMPGFRFTWNYDKQLEPEARYAKEDATKEFLRQALNKIKE